MKRTDRKSACPVTFCLEAVGDSWSLLILRDIALFGRHTYKEFLEAGERITTSVLAARLAHLENQDIIRKDPHPSDKRRDNYVLTEKGRGLIPVMLAMMEWGTAHDANSTGHRKKGFVAQLRKERGTLTREVTEKVRKGGSAFVLPPVKSR